MQCYVLHVTVVDGAREGQRGMPTASAGDRELEAP